jgi:hypothetical protein
MAPVTVGPVPHHSPEVSVVIAAIDGRSDVEASIAAVKQQPAGRVIEILLVANHDHPGIAARRSDDVTVLVSERRRLVPELWGLGFARAQAPIIAVTIAGCAPAPNWIEGIVRAHESADAGVGGAIDQHVSGGIVDWAVYFVRYAAYMPPMAAGPALQVPGDNGSYKKAALDEERAAIASQGFWEYEINARLVMRGKRLSLAPEMLVWHTHSFGVRGFCRQRWQHGRIFGRTRAAGLSGPTRLARTLMAPVSLAVMVGRAARHVFSRRRHRLAFLRALPLVVVFYSCWIAGETAGLFSGTA